MNVGLRDGAAGELALNALRFSRFDRVEYWQGVFARIQSVDGGDRQEEFTSLPTGEAWGPHVREPEGFRGFDMTNELLRPPRRWAEALESARIIELNIHDGLGGDSLTAKAMVEDLAGFQRKGGKCRAIGRGLIASAHGFLLTLCPGERLMTADAKLMLHGTMVPCVGNARRLAAVAKRIAGSDKALAQRLAKRCKAPVRAMRQFFDGKDHYLTAMTAKEAGLVDTIVDAAELESAQRWTVREPMPGPPPKTEPAKEGK
jgi:ATP-dependent protease ClpP protease subunit